MTRAFGGSGVSKVPNLERSESAPAKGLALSSIVPLASSACHGSRCAGASTNPPTSTLCTYASTAHAHAIAVANERCKWTVAHIDSRAKLGLARLACVHHCTLYRCAHVARFARIMSSVLKNTARIHFSTDRMQMTLPFVHPLPQDAVAATNRLAATAVRASGCHRRKSHVGSVARSGTKCSRAQRSARLAQSLRLGWSSRRESVCSSMRACSG